ncbi:Probable LRR receptor-like serine/threonine-protein kinase At3g47570 [Linum perenne]
MQLDLTFNNLSGEIPTSIFNLSSLTDLWFGYNYKLHGSLPWNLGVTLPNLENFDVAANQFTGSVPPSLSNASNLVLLQLYSNNFTGSMPSMTNSNKLVFFFITNNSLGSGKANDLSFLSSLTNATNLEDLHIHRNNFGGSLPQHLGNLSISLKSLVINDNKISGNIPSDIQYLVNLAEFWAYNNYLSGTIPSNIGKLKSLERLHLYNNKLSGHIPSSMGNLTKLIELDISDNYFSGKIPVSIQKCQKITLLRLSHNNLSGVIPQQLWSLTSLSISLDLSGNRFTGALPVEVGNLKNLESLDISHNMLSDTIPTSLGSCISLQGLYLQGNRLQGIIPSSFSSLRGIQELDLSSNNLSGQIPKFLESMDISSLLNLSYNNFDGEVPTQGAFKNSSIISVVGNSKLCGGVTALKLPPCSFTRHTKKTLSLKWKIVISTISSLLFLTFIGSCCFILLIKRRRRHDKSSTDDPKLLQLSYQRLFKATDGFSSANQIGVGSFGSVYKGVLNEIGEASINIAVKVFNLQRRGASKSFMAECEALKNIRHKNLVRIVTVCSSIDHEGNDFKALIYEFLASGSLEDWLHRPIERISESTTTRSLNFVQRLNVAIDIASAVDYLHNNCGTPIVHCDLKPSNVLLDEDMVAHVGDFGLARFLSAVANPSSSTIGIKGTIGYAPPEYGMGNEVSIQGDVYSYGILLLELFTGKRPTDETFKDGLSHHNIVKSALSKQRTSEVLDPILLNELLRRLTTHHNYATTSSPDEARKDLEKLMSSIFEIGVACSSDIPQERASMIEGLSGSISPHVGNLSFLKFLRLFNNSFTGEIPPEIGRLRRLERLSLFNNSLDGEIPPNISGCSALTIFRVENNELVGGLPWQLGLLNKLQFFRVRSNNFSRGIPLAFGNLSSLLVFDGARNQLSGRILSLTSLSMALDLSYNQFTGVLPVEVGDMKNLEYLDLSYNMLSGSIPSSLGSCIKLYTLYLDNNHLQGIIPSSFSSLRGIQELDLSSNNLSVVGNSKLCGGVTALQLPPCSFTRHKKKTMSLKWKIVISTISSLLFLTFIERIDESTTTRSLNFIQRLTVAIDIAYAVDYLHNNCGTPIVHCDLKPSNVLLDEDMVAHVSDFGLARFLSAVANPSSTNPSSSTIGIKGTIGYAPPEYGMGNEVSIQGDVYSYGILLLELFTGRRPTNETFKDGLSLHNIVKSALSKQHTSEVVDPILLNELLRRLTTHHNYATTSSSDEASSDEARKDLEKLMSSILEIGVACSSDIPQERASMSEVLSSLTAIRTSLIGRR